MKAGTQRNRDLHFLRQELFKEFFRRPEIGVQNRAGCRYFSRTVTAGIRVRSELIYQPKVFRRR
jgi:hypothetical protein